MKNGTLIIPDIHLNTNRADDIIARRKDEVVKQLLLGDVFDDFDDTVEANLSAAAWLRRFFEDGGEMAAGNHDAGYF